MADEKSVNLKGLGIFKDALLNKEYYSQRHSGLGRKTLELKDGSNILTQRDFDRENTVYVIQYDFTLGEDITIPDGCVLKFEGGSINGSYALTGNNTLIKAGIIKIFDSSITLNGSWNVSVAFPEWFGAIGNGTDDDTIALQKTIDVFFNVSLKSTYKVSHITVTNNGVVINGGKIISQDTGNSSNPYGIITILSDNVTIDGVVIQGSFVYLENGTDEQTWLWGVYAKGSYTNPDTNNERYINKAIEKLTISNCVISNVWTGIEVTPGRNIKIVSNNINNIEYTAISVSSTLDSTISNNNIKNVRGKYYPNNNLYNAYGICVTHSVNYPRSERVVVDSNIVENVVHWEAYDTHNGLEITFSNNKAKNVMAGVVLTSSGSNVTCNKCMVTGNTIIGRENIQPLYCGVQVVGKIYTNSNNKKEFINTEGNIIANNYLENFDIGIQGYLNFENMITGNVIKNCNNGFKFEAFAKTTVTGNQVSLKKADGGSNDAYIGHGFVVGTFSGWTSPTENAMISKITNNTFYNISADKYGFFAHGNINTSGSQIQCKDNTFDIVRSNEEIANDSAIQFSTNATATVSASIIRKTRAFGVDTGLNLVNCYKYVDVFAQAYISFTVASGSYITIPANSDVYIRTDSRLGDFQSGRPSIKMGRNVPGLSVFADNDSNYFGITIRNVTATDIVLFPTYFLVEWSSEMQDILL